MEADHDGGPGADAAVKSEGLTCARPSRGEEITSWLGG